MGCASSSPAASASEEKETPCTSAHSKYKFGEKIGRGSYAQVHNATESQTETEVAVKICRLDLEPDLHDSLLKAAIHEVTAWKAVGAHVNCVKLLESFYDGKLAYMVMERCDSSLFRYLQRRPAIYETCIGKVFEQILTGISHMHSVSVIHRDLKPDNFLVRGSTVKICDFGLSAIVPPCGFVKGIVGTPPYMSPEMLATQTSDEKADVWSFGAVAYVFLCGDFPYRGTDSGVEKMMASILNGEAPDCERDWLSIKARSFLRQLLRRKPSQRPSAKSALKSPFISNPDDNENLPSIRNVLRKMQKAGVAFSNSVALSTQTDLILNQLKNGELADASIKSFPVYRSESTTCGTCSSTSAFSKSFSKGLSVCSQQH